MGVITDPRLLARLRLADGAWLEHYVGLLGGFPPREWTPEGFDRGLRYPWYRPERSFLLRDGRTTLLHELDAAERAQVLERHATRTPLLAIGSNGAPRNLAVKVAHHADPDDREVLVLTGELRGLDVVASATVSVYGAMPASLALSAGTAVRASALLVTPEQLTTLTWGELSYQLGRLDEAVFVAEEGVEGVPVAAPLAFVPRLGLFAPGGEPVALAAIEARGRTLRAWSQRELLDRAAALVLGPGSDAEDLTRAVFADPAGFARRALPALQRHARRAGQPAWTPVA